jgi:alanine dehydrogenase
MIQHFFDNPSLYKSAFERYTKKTDLYISAHYWDPDSPRMFELNQMTDPDFRISMIADISCDIDGSVPSTLRASSIDSPFYGFDPSRGRECDPFNPLPPVTMMAVDNLPGELPRDASDDFSEILSREIIPKLIGSDPDKVIERATITKGGKLTERFAYLKNYADGR